MSEKKIIRAAVIGCGQRGKYVTNNLLNDSAGGVKIAAVYDPDPERMKDVMEFWKSPDTNPCSSMEEAVNAEGIEWVMIFSPNAFHKEGILAAFKAGKHVFSEKPLATTVEDCQEIYEAQKKYGKLFMTGFVLRYSKLYRKAKEILSSGMLGQLYSIDANENIAPAHGGYIMTNWRRYTKYAGPHILEKCCHDIDLLNWFVGSLPSKIASFASLDFFVPENEHYFHEFPPKTFDSWVDPHRSKENAFLSEKDLKDNRVAIMLYRNGVKVQFQATMSNAIPERRMYFSCAEGTMRLELYSSELSYKRIGEDMVTIHYGADGHGGGDNFIMKELYECMTTGAEPKSSGLEGLESAVTALMIDKASIEEKVLDVEPVWAKLNR